MKRLLAILLTLTAVMALNLALISCGGDKKKAHEHIPGNLVRENEVAATCVSYGKYEEVVYCSDIECREELTRNTVSIEKQKHTPGEPIEEKRIEPTYESDGSYEIAIYCTFEECGAELERTRYTLDLLVHHPGRAVRENAVDATCTETGSYDEVVYCLDEDCGYKELSRKTVTVETIPHTEGISVNENEIAAKCLEGGSYEEVIYCTGCDFEFSRKHVVTEAKGHVYVDDKCTVCGNDEPSEGLRYTSNGDGTCYVSGIGSCTDKNVIIPNISPEGDVVTGIGDDAFYNRYSLTSVVIPNGVTSIGEYAFGQCSSLTSIEVDEENTAYKSIDGNLYTKDGKTLVQYAGGKTDTSFTIPDGVTTIGNSAFYYCESLTSIEIPDSVTSIGNSAFYYCKSLTSIEIPDSVTSIGDKAFYYCKSLTSIEIPDSVTSIGDKAFSDCDSLTSVVIPDNVTSIGNSAFYSCDSLKSVEIGSGVTDIGDDAFCLCKGLTSVHTKDIASWCNINFHDTYANPLCYGEDLYLGGTLVTNLVIPNSVKSIDSRAFSNCLSLMSVAISDSVTSIGYEAFSDCSRLKSVEIGNGVTHIAGNAFEDCIGLTSVYVKDIVSWCDIDFYGDYSNPLYYAGNLYVKGELVTNLVIPNGVTSIGEYAFSDCDSLTSLVIPDSVRSIDTSAFEGCVNLKNVEISDRVTSIGEYAFLGCESLTSVYVKDIVSWCDIDFYHKYSNPLYYAGNLYLNGDLVTDLVIPKNVTSIGYIFCGCTSLKSVEIPNSVTSIGYSAFASCTSLKSVKIPNSVTSVEVSAFDECTSLKSITVDKNNTVYKSLNGDLYTKDGKTLVKYAVGKPDTSFTIPDGVENIGFNAFSDCVILTSVVIPDSVTSIGIQAFRNCNRLISVVIGDSVESIDNYAFGGCERLVRVYYKGTADKWSKIKVKSDGNDYIIDSTLYYYSETKPTTGGNFWHYDDAGNVVVWEK